MASREALTQDLNDIRAIAVKIQPSYIRECSELYDICARISARAALATPEAAPPLTKDIVVELIQDALGQWGGPKREYYTQAMNRAIDCVENYCKGLDVFGRPIHQIHDDVKQDAGDAPSGESQTNAPAANVEGMQESLRLSSRRVQELENALEKMTDLLTGSTAAERGYASYSWQRVYQEIEGLIRTQEALCGTANVDTSTSEATLPTVKIAPPSEAVLLPDQEWRSLSPDSQHKLQTWFRLATERLQLILDEPAAQPQREARGADTRRTIQMLECSLRDYMHLASEHELTQFSYYGPAKDALEAAANALAAPKPLGEELK